ncbi:iron-sulfur cluster carrier protein ApbC [Alishewanella sp. d11]|uniref:iron-sulfur cluster carrier protein ApbC n=1 Tax=Alishewanella sp. d11 TaxID=3414030 RepID=UPI003BF89A80
MFNWLKKSATAQVKNGLASTVDTPAKVAEQDHVARQIDMLRLREPAFKQIQTIILVASGKGGVGKSTTAANLAMALAALGVRTGLLDADIYGPSVPTLFALQGEKVTSPDNKLMLPLTRHGVTLQSIGFLVDPAQASVWRGPMASQALLQLLNETLWPELDVLLIDMPPGTGDIQLTLSQKLPVTGAVVVTTPQDLALADAQKAIAMFNQVQIPLLGLVENMSFYLCPSCGNHDDVFGSAGGLTLAQRHNVAVLGQLPLQGTIRLQADNGVALSAGDVQLKDLYENISRTLLQRLSGELPQPVAVEIIITDD